MRIVVEVGKTYGSLEVIERAGSSPKGAALFRCLCHECGKECIVEGQRLTRGNPPKWNCGCVRRERFRDIVGETHGSVTVVERLPYNYHSGDKMYIVKCSLCGNTRDMPKSQIIANPKSCGCLHYEPARMMGASKLGIEEMVVDGVNIYTAYRHEANKNSKTGVRGVFPERRNGVLTGAYRASVKVHGEVKIKTGFATVESAKAWRDETQQELLKKYNVADSRKKKD